MAGLSLNGDVIQLATELHRVTSLNAFYDVIGRWLRRIITLDHYNFLLVFQKQGLYHRHFSSGFPREIFENYESRSSSDFVLKLALSSKAGACIHFDSIKDRPEAPKGWAGLKAHVAEGMAFRDSVSIVLLNKKTNGRGAGLTLWRVKPSPPFSAIEVAFIKQIGPLLAAAYERVDGAIFEAAKNEALNTVLTGTGKYVFLVDRNAELLTPDGDLLERIGILADGKSKAGVMASATLLPLKVSASIRGLIKVLDSSSVPSGPVSEESAGWTEQCRVFVSRNKERIAGVETFRVAIATCDRYTDLSHLAAADYSDLQIQILDGFQRGLYAKEIAGNLNINEDAVRQQLKTITSRLGVRILPHIVNCATARARELALEKALANNRVLSLDEIFLPLDAT